MRATIIRVIFLAVTVFAVGGWSAAASAAPIYVSAQTGFDTYNGLSPLTPVRTIVKAVSLATAKSHIVIIDSGTYDTFSVNKSLIIEAAPGVVALIPATGGNAAASISAPASDVVLLRGLSFTGGGPSAGIFSTSGSVSIENCTVSGFTNYGIYVDVGSLYVKDTVVTNCGWGIFVNSSQPAVTSVATIEHCRLEKNVSGLLAYDNTRVTVRDSVASGNTNYGFQAAALGGWFSDLTVENCLANGNGVGVIADNTWGSAVTVRVSNSSVTGNATGLRQTAGTTFYSRGNNTVNGNTSSNVQGTITLMSGV